MWKTFYEKYPKYDFCSPITDKDKVFIRKYKEAKDKYNDLSQEVKDKILSDRYNEDDKRWEEMKERCK